jgi:hypothetical protein
MGGGGGALSQSVAPGRHLALEDLGQVDRFGQSEQSRKLGPAVSAEPA